VKKRVLTAAVGDPPALGALLEARLPLSREEVERLIARGAVWVDGRRVTRAAEPVLVGARVLVREGAPPAREGGPILAYEDAWLLVVDKPPGQPSQATPSEAASALDAEVRRRFPEARIMHRLDRDASGLVLFAGNAAARRPLQRGLSSGEIDRRYVARVAGRVQGEGRIALRIGKDGRDPRRRVTHPEASTAGQAAASRFHALTTGDDSSTLELTLETGRTHQLRVHLQAIGHPILGDRLYGGPAAQRLCLHATRLRLPHPEDGHWVEVVSPVPAELGVTG
jgi:RluA family pseudouridine synthase